MPSFFTSVVAVFLHVVFINFFQVFGSAFWKKKSKQNGIPKIIYLNVPLHHLVPSGVADTLSFFLAGDEGKLVDGSGWGFPCKDDGVSSFLLTCGDDCAGFSITSHSWSCKKKDKHLTTWVNYLSNFFCDFYKLIRGSDNCCSLCSEKCFKILDLASTSFQ